MAYTRKEIIGKIEPPTKSLYQKACVNYVGLTTDTKEKYTEVISEHVLTNLEEYKNSIITVSRRGSYKVKSHKEYDYKFADPSFLRSEERLARSLMGRKLGNLEILDYQVPLKSPEGTKNKGLGKIDLLAWDGKSLVILEFKRPDSSETLLRCVLEAFTYWETVDREKLANDFRDKTRDIDKDVPVRAAALVFKDSNPHKDWLDVKKPRVKELMERLGVGLYVYELYIGLTEV